MHEAMEKPAAAARLRKSAVIYSALALLVLCPAHVSAGEPISVLVVVNTAGPLANATEAQIRDVFMGRLRLAGGIRVRPIQMEGPARRVLLRALLGMSEYEFQFYWARKSYEDGQLPPLLRPGPDQVLEYVAHETGAVGFVDRDSFRRVDRVKVVYEASEQKE